MKRAIAFPVAILLAVMWYATSPDPAAASGGSAPPTFRPGPFRTPVVASDSDNDSTSENGTTPATMTPFMVDSTAKPVRLYVKNIVDTSGDAPWDHWPREMVGSPKRGAYWVSQDSGYVLKDSGCLKWYLKWARTKGAPDTVFLVDSCAQVVTGFWTEGDTLANCPIIGINGVRVWSANERAGRSNAYKPDTLIIEGRYYVCANCSGTAALTPGNGYHLLGSDSSANIYNWPGRLIFEDSSGIEITHYTTATDGITTTFVNRFKFRATGTAPADTLIITPLVFGREFTVSDTNTQKHFMCGGAISPGGVMLATNDSIVGWSWVLSNPVGTSIKYEGTQRFSPVAASAFSNAAAIRVKYYPYNQFVSPHELRRVRLEYRSRGSTTWNVAATLLVDSYDLTDVSGPSPFHFTVHVQRKP